MTDTWTPGPRSIEEHDEDGMTVWDTYVHVPGEDNGDLLVGKFATRADAALDAAAPELVEALRDIRDDVLNMKDGDPLGALDLILGRACALLDRIEKEASGGA